MPNLEGRGARAKKWLYTGHASGHPARAPPVSPPHLHPLPPPRFTRVLRSGARGGSRRRSSVSSLFKKKKLELGAEAEAAIGRRLEQEKLEEEEREQTRYARAQGRAQNGHGLGA